MSNKSDAFMTELQALCERHQVEIRPNGAPSIVIDDASEFSKSYGYVAAVEDHITGDPVGQEDQVDQLVDDLTSDGFTHFRDQTHLQAAVSLYNKGWRKTALTEKGKTE